MYSYVYVHVHVQSYMYTPVCVHTQLVSFGGLDWLLQWWGAPVTLTIFRQSLSQCVCHIAICIGSNHVLLWTLV